MPRLEAKIIQRELEQGLVWPVYWLYGPERMKSRELFKRIRKRVLGEDAGRSVLGFAEETFDGAETDAMTIVDAAQSPSLGGGCRLITVRDAHAIKNSEELITLLGARAKSEELPSVCVFFSKDLDARKKFSKALIEKAAVIACEIFENERADWIEYLAKKRSLALSPDTVVRLGALDPWSLDIVDQELEKYSLLSKDPESGLLGSAGAELKGTDVFIDSFFARRLKETLVSLEGFADDPDQSIPFVGLLAWNVRHLAIVLADKRAGRRSNLKMNPHAAEKVQRWARLWSLDEVLSLQAELTHLDYSLKQTPLMPVGVWGELVERFCK